MIEQINYKEKLYLLKHNKPPMFLYLSKLMYQDLCSEFNVSKMEIYHGIVIKITNTKDILLTNDKA